MKFELPPLDYSLDALQPHLSGETLEYHHGKHHKKYVDTLNELIRGTEYENKDLETIIRTSSGKVYNNAGQHYNHSLYWNCLAPGGPKKPEGELAKAIDQAFGDFDSFKEKFSNEAKTLFGSGWTWLVRNSKGNLAIEPRANAGCPIDAGALPLLTCDVWEHAYYVDYRNRRPDYVDAFWNLVNWDFVASRLKSS